MFDITGDHIIKLNDEDLRTLTARLCEAELRKTNLPLAAISAGGNQDAKDGGIDVRIELPEGSPTLDFIPRNLTGFQVKQPDMPPSEIKKEMRPNGKLRSSIINLASKHGAYVIISAQGSTADSALENRRSAMQSAATELTHSTSLHLDFYDRDRLARWVRSYPGVALWLRERIGEPLAGWWSYGNWAYGGVVDSEYLLDDKCRIVAPQTSQDPLTVEQGIQSMRAILANSGSVVRLIGLSGTGKTRLVQALFDSKVGNNALDRSVAVYVDQGSDQSPIPSARDMVNRLVANGQRAILIVDNCNPTTHRDLAQAVNGVGALLSLITVEYDVADDEPEETDVFKLEPASEQIIEEILQRLTPNVSQADRLRIAEFSGGNARIALALARTINYHESVATLNDSELFKRLFHQRKSGSETLMRSAEVCSLVYSFDGEIADEDGAELSILANLAEISINELYRNISELKIRDLMQRRGKWRAVLPHAIANRLARQALSGIHIELLIDTFLHEGNERLLKSFSRRLGYLHDSDRAKQIAERWLKYPGLVSDPAQLNPLGISIFMSIAPLTPELALQAIETSAFGENRKEFLSIERPNRWGWIELLRSIAYEPQYFNRVAILLAKYIAEEPANHNHNSALDSFKELFHLYLSGTHALIGSRLNVVRRLLEAEDVDDNTAGLEALDAMLECTHFRSSHDFSFGAKSRDFGWKPETGNDVSGWYQEVISFAKSLVTASSCHAAKIKIMFATHFRGLWRHAGICTELEELVRDFSDSNNRVDWWFALRRTIYYDIKRMPPALAARIRILESALRPVGLEQRIQAHILSQNHEHLELIDEEAEDGSHTVVKKGWERANKLVEDLGIEAGFVPDTLTRLLPDLLRHNGRVKYQFGRGLAQVVPNVDETWKQLCDVLMTISENERDVSLLQGFIEAAYVRNPDKVDQLLDEAITDPVLGPFSPILQSSIQIDEIGAKRLILSIAEGYAKAEMFIHINAGGVSNSIPSSLFKQILLGVASLPNGYGVSIHIFAMWLYLFKSSKTEIDRETCALGRDLLKLNDFRSDDHNNAYHIKEIADACLREEIAFKDALEISSTLDQALKDYRSGARSYNGLARTLFKLQPIAALTIFLDGNSNSYSSLSSLFSHDKKESPVNAADPGILMAWVKEKPAVRLPKLAKEVQICTGNGENNSLMWSPLALEILKIAPDRREVLNIFESQFYPEIWSGSVADILISYLSLVEELKVYNDVEVRDWARDQAVALRERIEKERKKYHQVDESFE